MDRYDTRLSYEANYRRPPAIPAGESVECWPGDWHCCGWPLTAPLAVAAGPLLNGDWLRYYAALGFEWLTYKTVRRTSWPCYDLPNLQSVCAGRVDETTRQVRASERWEGSWAVSFGMPSPSPERWQADVRATRRQLPPTAALAVSVVATPERDTSVAALADDYAWCAEHAVAAGADAIELNLSCPNVSSCDGQLYRQPASVGQIVATVRARMGNLPLLLKLGALQDIAIIDGLLDAVEPHVQALVMVNCFACRVQADGRPLFANQARGIAGRAIHEAAVRQIATFRERVERTQATLELIGGGGASEVADVHRFLSAGASCVQMATAVMREPAVAMRLRGEAQRAVDPQGIPPANATTRRRSEGDQLT